MRLIRQIAGAGCSGSSLAFSATQQKSGDCLSREEGVRFCNLKQKENISLLVSNFCIDVFMIFKW